MKKNLGFKFTVYGSELYCNLILMNTYTNWDNTRGPIGTNSWAYNDVFRSWKA